VVMNDLNDGSVVGAGSIVTREVPPYAVAIGNPARVLRSRLDSPFPASPASEASAGKVSNMKLARSST
ncbi:MAG: hypothetical protein ACK58L_02415, partial [Planctomycetota bacterium]